MALVVTSAGPRLNEDAAGSYEQLNKAFTARFGKRLTINSGARTYAEQENIFRNSYRNYFIANTSRRYWKGEWWYLRPGFATVAAPGTSNHEYPPGRAADFGNGVHLRHSAEHNWMLANAGNYGWTWTGGKFVTIEPWHWEKTGSYEAPAGGGSTPFDPKPDPEEDDVLDKDRDYEAFKNMMWRFLKFESRDGGPVADGKQGPTVFERLNAAAGKPDAGQTAAAVLNTQLDTQGTFGKGRKTTLGSMLAWNDDHVISTQALVKAIEPVSDAQVKAIADAVIAQIGTPTVAVDYDKIATDVRAKFKSEPLV